MPEERERLGGSSTAMLRGFATLFAQQGFGEVSPEFLQNIAGQWTNILADMFARGEGSSAEFAALIREKLAAAFTDMGIDAKKDLKSSTRRRRRPLARHKSRLTHSRKTRTSLPILVWRSVASRPSWNKGFRLAFISRKSRPESMTKNGIRLFDDDASATREPVPSHREREDLR